MPDLEVILDKIKDRCSSPHAPAFTMALNELVTDLSRSTERDPTLLDVLLRVCHDYPVPHRHAMPAHINSAKATLRSILGALLPAALRPLPVTGEAWYSPWDSSWDNAPKETTPVAKPPGSTSMQAPVAAAPSPVTSVTTPWPCESTAPCNANAVAPPVLGVGTPERRPAGNVARATQVIVRMRVQGPNAQSVIPVVEVRIAPFE